MLNFSINYAILFVSLLIPVAIIGTVLSLFITLGQHQAGCEIWITVDDTGFTEEWSNRRVRVDWNDVKRITLRRNFIQIRTKATRLHWHIFRSSIGDQNFEQLTEFIRQQTAA